jgi:hypothetical protein
MHKGWIYEIDISDDLGKYYDLSVNVKLYQGTFTVTHWWGNGHGICINEDTGRVDHVRGMILDEDFQYFEGSSDLLDQAFYFMRMNPMRQLKEIERLVGYEDSSNGSCGSCGGYFGGVSYEEANRRALRQTS